MNIGSDIIDTVRDQDYWRYISYLYAPESARPYLILLTAFHLELGRIHARAHEPLMGEVRLTWWHESLETLYADHPATTHPLLAAMQQAGFHQRVALESLDRMIGARIAALYEPDAGSPEFLRQFLDDSSGELAAASCAILCNGTPAAATVEAARHIGSAWGEIDIIRATGFQDGALPAPPPALLQARVKQAMQRLDAARALRRQCDAAARPVLAQAVLADDSARRLLAVQCDPARFQASDGAIRRHVKLLRANLSGRY